MLNMRESEHVHVKDLHGYLQLLKEVLLVQQWEVWLVLLVALLIQHKINRKKYVTCLSLTSMGDQFLLTISIQHQANK